MSNVLTYKKLWDSKQIAATNDLIYTAACSTTTGVVENIAAVIANTTTGGVTVEIWVVPSAGTPGDAYAVVPGEIVPAKGRLSFRVPKMKDGDELYAKAGSATSLTIHCLAGLIVN